MKIADINPFVRHALIIRYHSFIEKRFIMGYDTRLFYIVEGEGTLSFDNNTYSVVTGDMIIIGPAVSYLLAAGDPGGLELAVLNFDYTPGHRHDHKPLRPVEATLFDNRKVMEAAHFEDCPHFNRPLILHDMQHLEMDLIDMVREFTEHKILYREKMSAIARNVLLTAARTAFIAEGNASRKTEALANAAIEYIHRHYQEESLDNAGIGDALNYHPYYVSHLMKTCTGMSLHQYLIHLRIRTAMDLLTSTQLSIAQIAEQVGFKSQSHFSYRFKKSMGKSPMAYRRDFLGL